MSHPGRIGDIVRMTTTMVFSLAATTLTLAISCSRGTSPEYSSVISTNSNASATSSTINSNSPASTSTNGDSRASPNQEQVLPAPGFANDSPIAQAQRIHDSLLAETSLAPLANTVHVSRTSEGRVVLTGSVTTPEEKRRVNDIAERVAGAGNVDNQLEIK